MAVLISLAIGGALVAAGTQAVSARRAGKAAESQAKTQKKAANRYAKALRSQASKLQGGMSAAQQRTLKTDAALDRAALGQQARDEAKRGGQSPSVALEADLAASMQASMAEQQKMIDQLSNQEAQAKAAQRQALRGQALQTEMQAQAINPEAIRKGATAPAFAQVGAALAQPAMQLGVSGLAQQAQLQGTARGYDALKANEGRSATETQALLDSYFGRNSGRGGSAT
jgi:hypothetical protein